MARTSEWPDILVRKVLEIEWIKFMIVKNPPLVIHEDNPFKEDALNRAESAEILTGLLSTIETPFVLAIDSGWGTGKTTFVRMWKQQLETSGYPCLYFNAWENDFSSDPLIAFIGEMKAGIDHFKLSPDRASKAKEYFEKTKKIGSSIAKKIIPITLKVGTAGVLDLDAFSEKSLAEFTEKIAQDKIDQYEADKLTMQEFRNTLKTFVEEISKTETEEKRPLVFFIDELDRCRPTYAVELLERVKHLFNIPGIFFVLTLDKDQVGHSIRALYGAGMNVDGYLRRFIDLEYLLPAPSTESFCKYLFGRFGFENYFRLRTTTDAHYEKEQLLETFVNLSQAFNFSLRVQEQCFSQFSLALRTTPATFKLHMPFLATLIALKAANTSLYKSYITRSVDPKKVVTYIVDKCANSRFMDEGYGIAIEAYIMTGHCQRDGDIAAVATIYQKAAENAKDEKERERVNRTLDIINKYIARDYHYVLDYLIKKIEISERFAK